MICFKDIQPTWETLEFDKGLDCVPVTALSRRAMDPLDINTVTCFSFPDKDEEVYYYPQTDITVEKKALQQKSETLEKLLKFQGHDRGTYLCLSNMYADTYIMPYIIDDHLVFRKLQITIVCGMSEMAYKCRTLPITEMSRYVFYENGVVVENRDCSRIFTTPDKLIDDSITDVRNSVSKYDDLVLFQTFCEKVQIPYKKKIVQLLKNRQADPWWVKERPRLYFKKLIRLYMYAVEAKDQFENIPERIVNDLRYRSYDSNTSVRLYKDLILVTGSIKDSLKESSTNFRIKWRIYADGDNCYYFKQNIVTGTWKRTESVRDLFEYDIYGNNLYSKVVDKAVFEKTCLEKYVNYSIAKNIGKRRDKVDLYIMLVQRDYLAAEQAAKISETLLSNIVYTIYEEEGIDKTQKLSDFLGLTGLQIKYLTEYDYLNRRLNLKAFGNYMRSNGFITCFPDVKRRIFIAMMRTEYEKGNCGEKRVDDEMFFEGAQTLNSIANASIGKRERLCEVYIDYLKMRRILFDFLSKLDTDDPFYSDIEKYVDMPINIKPSRIFERHQDIDKLLNFCRKKEVIKQYSPAIIRRKELEAGDVEYSDGEYSIIMPEDAADIIREGIELRHCVGSAGYIESMADNHCRILFLRKNSELSKPLITLEEREGCIRQCYGYRDSYNRNVQIRDFIKQYADKRGIGITAIIFKTDGV
ncbi:MAG: PcfJ domain-containing protein [Lachnospiraceae bacterium]|nr:PcfJ domain-containing protein [Lachnospiraceae bacterium]